MGPALAHALLAESLPVSLAWLEAMRQRKVWDVLPPHQAPQSLLLPPLDEGAAPHAVQLEGWQPPTEALLEGWIAIFSPAAHVSAARRGWGGGGRAGRRGGRAGHLH